MHYKYPDVDRLTQWLIDNKNALDGELEITEKLDGANFSFYKSNGEAIWRSRSGIIKPENLNNFREAIEFVSPIVAKLKDNEVIFGENVAKHHRIKYNDDRHAFYAFGIYDINAGAFMNSWRRRCKNLGLPTVQVIKHDGLTMEGLLELRSGSSMIGEHIVTGKQIGRAHV